jgi:hypothetical protein
MCRTAVVAVVGMAAARRDWWMHARAACLMLKADGIAKEHMFNGLCLVTSLDVDVDQAGGWCCTVAAPAVGVACSGPFGDCANPISAVDLQQLCELGMSVCSRHAQKSLFVQQYQGCTCIRSCAG